MWLIACLAALWVPPSSGTLPGMRIPIQINPEQDVAYIPLAPHDPLRRAWPCLGRNLVLDIDRHGELVGVELLNARRQLRVLGVRLGIR